MATKVLLDENGNFLDIVDEPDQVETLLEPENDPYWDAPIPKAERKHKRDKIQDSAAMKRVKIAIIILAPIIIIACLYYIVNSILTA